MSNQYILYYYILLYIIYCYFIIVNKNLRFIINNLLTLI